MKRYFTLKSLGLGGLGVLVLLGLVALGMDFSPPVDSSPLAAQLNGLLLDMTRHLQSPGAMSGDILQIDHRSFAQNLHALEIRPGSGSRLAFWLLTQKCQNMHHALTEFLQDEEAVHQTLMEQTRVQDQAPRLVDRYLLSKTSSNPLQTQKKRTLAESIKVEILSTLLRSHQVYERTSAPSLDEVLAPLKSLRSDFTAWPAQEKLARNPELWEALQSWLDRYQDLTRRRVEGERKKEAAFLHWTQAQRELALALDVAPTTQPSHFWPLRLALAGLALFLMMGLFNVLSRQYWLRRTKALIDRVVTGDLSETTIPRAPFSLSGFAESISRLMGVVLRSEKLVYQLATLVESAGDALIGIKADGTILSWNKTAQQIYGYRPDEAKGKSVAILFPKYWEQKVQDMLGGLKEQECIPYHTVQVHKNGESFPTLLVFSAIRDSTGGMIGASILARPLASPSKILPSSDPLISSVLRPRPTMEED